MVALLSLVVALVIARCADRLRTVLAVQIPAFALGAAALIGTSPNHGSSYATGVLLAVALIPLTVLMLALGRRWRSRGVATIA